MTIRDVIKKYWVVAVVIAIAGYVWHVESSMEALKKQAMVAVPANFQVGNGQTTTTVPTLNAVMSSLQVTELIRANVQKANEQRNQETGDANPSNPLTRPASE